MSPAARDAARMLGVVLTGEPGVDRLRRKSGKPAGSLVPGDAGRSATAAPSVVTVPTPVPTTVLRISVGADHGGLALKDAIVRRLRELGHSVDDRGTNTTDPVDYPDLAVAVATDVARNVADVGIMVDGAGIGSCMAANKVAGVRAAQCHDITTARNAREHNHANLLTLGGGLVGARLGLDIVEAFLATPFGGARHAARVAKIDALDVARSTDRR